MDLANPQQRIAPAGAAQNFFSRVDDLLDWTTLAELMDVASARAQSRLPLAAVKIALLKHWYALADSVAEFEVLDRLSFRSFVGFAGDGGAADAAILNELNGGFWSQQPEMGLLVEAVEQQLRDQGYTIRSGQLAEPSLVPCTESGEGASQAVETALYRPGDLGRMVEAVTAKAHAQGRMPTAAQPPRDAPAVSEDFPRPVDQQPVAESEGEEIVQESGRIRAVLEWPWGYKSELTEHLYVGRDFGFSPFARELTPYTHVSRKHAELLVYGDGVWIRDLGSRNGTYVNNDEVPTGQAYLIDGDCIVRFGPLLAVSLKILS